MDMAEPSASLGQPVARMALEHNGDLIPATTSSSRITFWQHPEDTHIELVASDQQRKFDG